MDATPAPASAPAGVTTPLLYGTVPPGAPEPMAEPTARPAPATASVNRLQRTAVGLFAGLHILRGLFCLAYPASGLSSFDLPRSGATFLLSALLGVRDMLLGGLLATATTTTCSAGDGDGNDNGGGGCKEGGGGCAGSRCGADRELRRALAVNLLSDAADTFILIFSAACAWQRRNPVAEIGVVATMAILEHLTLWTMAAGSDSAGSTVRNQAVAAYEARLQAHEDKQLRLDMWLADMRRDEEMRRTCSPRPARE
ncbi:hypothetical protein CDD83_7847 [Cordyceps sp. RAO-2017]|nr:hypothetical protein CDD83_7847 [Cordyceps sp. RAO-2017]